jgi:rod shape-determining protein MreD
MRLIHTDVSREASERHVVSGPTDPILRCVRATTERPGGLPISYVSPLLAVIVGILHAALAPVIVVGGVKPNLVLVAVVLVTVLVGLLPGIVWAFSAGVTANLLVGDPLGSVPLALLLVSVAVAAGARAFGALSWVYPVVATFAASLLADTIGLGVAGLVTDAPPTEFPGRIVLVAAVINAVIAALVLFPARFFAGRYATDEAVAW